MDAMDFFDTYPVDKNSSDFSPEELDMIAKCFPTKAADFLTLTGRATFRQGFLRTMLPSDLDFVGIQVHWSLKGARRFPLLCTAFGTVIFYTLGLGFHYINPVRGEIVYMGYNFNRVLNGYLTAPELMNREFFLGTYFESRGHALKLKGMNMLCLPANYDPATFNIQGPLQVCDIRELYQQLGDAHLHIIKPGKHSFSNGNKRGETAIDQAA